MRPTETMRTMSRAGSQMRKLERGTIGGLAVAVAAITIGLFLEGGHIAQILQPTAAIIVLGGTWGAVLVQFPSASVRQAMVRLQDAFSAHPASSQSRADHIIRLAMQARRNGVVSLDVELKLIADPFFRKALMLAVDGIAPREIRQIMELDLARIEEDEEQAARVWEAAGGFSPTIGILGAVLGLIQVMQHLDDISAVGRGIAVAFVATLYGVGLANLVFLPLAGKLRLRAREAHMLREATLAGVLSIAEGVSPRTLRERLNVPAAPQVAPVARMVAR
jgi:chemotaxis protein MotA